MSPPAVKIDPDGYAAARHGCAIIRRLSDRVLRIAGAEAIEAVDALFSMDIETLLPNRGVTGAFLTDDGALIAVATLFRGEEDLILFAQDIAGDALQRHLGDALDGRGAAPAVLNAAHDIVCLLGPHAERAMARNAGEDILGLPYLSYEKNPDLGRFVFRMGYAGEYEYRVLAPKGDTEIAERLSQPGDDFTVSEISEETLPLLMLEMRSLTDADLNDDRCPLAAGMHWMIDFRKPAFPGKAALRRRLDALAATGLMLRFDGSEPPAAGSALTIESRDVGRIVKSAYSPTLDSVIALAYVEAPLSWVGVRFEVEAGGGEPIVGLGVSAPLFVTRTVLDA